MSEPVEQTKPNHSESPETTAQGMSQDEVVEIMKDVPPQIQQMMASFMMGPPPNPIMNKINEKHIDKAMDLAGQAIENNHIIDNRELDIKISNRWFVFAVLSLILVVLVILVIKLQDKPEVLLPIITGLVGLGAGAMGGYGYGKSKTVS